MSLFEDASLVMIPSGYKAGKVYSIKPSNGDGDFTFSRASAATRVNADGLIEKETQNLLLQSNQFDTTWTNTNTTETGGQSDKDGGTDAWLLNKTAAIGRIEQSASGSGVYTFSVYAKAGSLNWIRLLIAHSSTNPSVYFDLSGSGAIGTEQSVIQSNIESVGSGWFRCSIVGDVSTITALRIYPADGDGDVSGTSGNIYIQDAQLEEGLVARDYIETTTTAVYEGITDNVPRLDYTDASCPSLLLEPQRTNLITYSEYFNGLSFINATADDNSETSPEGYINASKLYDNSTNGQHRVGENISVVSGTTYTWSIFAKKGSLRYCYLLSTADGVQRYFFDLQEGTAITSGGKIEDYGNGWFRISAQITSSATDNRTFGFNLTNGPSNITYTGTGTDYHIIYGFQVEAGSYPTSYIPTYGTSVTRVTEPNAINKTDLVADGFFSSTELTWFIDINLFEKDSGTSVAPRLINSSNGNIFIGLNETLGGNLNIRHKDGTTAANTSGVSFDENGQRFKVLVKVSGTTGEAFINGSSMGTFTTLAASNYDEFENVAANAYDLRQMLMFPTALTDQEAIDLTTL